MGKVTNQIHCSSVLIGTNRILGLAMAFSDPLRLDESVPVGPNIEFTTALASAVPGAFAPAAHPPKTVSATASLHADQSYI
jgi:hypothetical protein